VKPLPLPPPRRPVPEITRTEATMFMALAFAITSIRPRCPSRGGDPPS